MLWGFEECSYGVCKRLMPQDIMDLVLNDKELGLNMLILHNPLYMKKSLAVEDD